MSAYSFQQCLMTVRAVAVFVAVALTVSVGLVAAMLKVLASHHSYNFESCWPCRMVLEDLRSCLEKHEQIVFDDVCTSHCCLRQRLAPVVGELIYSAPGVMLMAAEPAQQIESPFDSLNARTFFRCMEQNDRQADGNRSGCGAGTAPLPCTL